ncbi:MAG: YD repeat-containing protein, partial [bacterium]
FYQATEALPDVVGRIPKKLKFICTTKVPAKIFGGFLCNRGQSTQINYIDPNDPVEGVIKIFGNLSAIPIRGEVIGSGQGEVGPFPTNLDVVLCENYQLYVTNISGVDSVYFLQFSPSNPTIVNKPVVANISNDSATVNNLESTPFSWQQEYIYDRYGNRKEVIGLNEQNLSISLSRNRITTAGYEYDNAGNLKADPSGKTYQYDAENRLVKVMNGTTEVAIYEYDGNGLRVRKIANGVITRFVYNDGRLISEYEGELVASLSSPTKEYYYGVSGLLATADGDNPLQYHTPDHLGSPRVITNSTGKIVSRRDFLPFGEQIDPSLGNRGFISGYIADNNLRQHFTGYFRDEETSLDFAQARHFSSNQGRFTSVDPLGKSAEIEDPQTWNRYAYVSNNPINDTDPLGLQRNRTKEQSQVTYDAAVGAAKSLANVPIGINNLMVNLGFGPKKDLIEPYEPSNQIQASSMTITDSLLIALPLAGRGSLTGVGVLTAGKVAGATDSIASSGSKAIGEAVSLDKTGFNSSDFRFTDAMKDKQFSKLVKSVQAEGIKNPEIQYTVINNKPYIVLGNNRFLAARLLNKLDQLRFKQVETPVKGTNFDTPGDVTGASPEVRLPQYRGK